MDDGARAGPARATLCGASAFRLLRPAISVQHRLCRYVLGPPLATARLRWLDPDTLTVTPMTPWADGTTQLLLSP